MIEPYRDRERRHRILNRHGAHANAAEEPAVGDDTAGRDETMRLVQPDDPLRRRRHAARPRRAGPGREGDKPRRDRDGGSGEGTARHLVRCRNVARHATGWAHAGQTVGEPVGSGPAREHGSGRLERGDGRCALGRHGGERRAAGGRRQAVYVDVVRRREGDVLERQRGRRGGGAAGRSRRPAHGADGPGSAGTIAPPLIKSGAGRRFERHVGRLRTRHACRFGSGRDGCTWHAGCCARLPNPRADCRNLGREPLIQRRRIPTGAAVSAPTFHGGAAQVRRETLLPIGENPPGSTDIHRVGRNRSAREVSCNAHDRLMTLGVKGHANGADRFDDTRLEHELAASRDLTPGASTFQLRRDADVQDGAPVTAEDVTLSFDRTVSVGGFRTSKMRAASLGKPERFAVVDRHTFRADFIRSDTLTMPDLGAPVRVVHASGLATHHATATPSWPREWLPAGPSGGGAFRLERRVRGREAVSRRFDDCRSGRRPPLARVIWRIVPGAGNRRTLLEPRDAAICFGRPPRDFRVLAAARRLKIVGTPVENAIRCIGANVTRTASNDVSVRQGIAFPMSCQRMTNHLTFGTAVPMFGAPAGPADATRPRPFPYVTDLERARALLVEAEHENGIGTTIGFDRGLAAPNEPIAILAAGSLERSGMRTTIGLVPGSSWRNALLKKAMPMMTSTFGGWLSLPDCVLFRAYRGRNAVFSTMSCQDPEVDAPIERSRFTRGEAELVSVFHDLPGSAPAPLRRLARISSPPPHVTGFHMIDSAFAGPAPVPKDPLASSAAALPAPSARHCSGTEGLGRDVFPYGAVAKRLDPGIASAVVARGELGRIVEEGPAEAEFRAQAYPCTRALVDSVAMPGVVREGERLRLTGDPRSPIDPAPNACRFHGRCLRGVALCGGTAPPEIVAGKRRPALRHRPLLAAGTREAA